jgi:6-methylsalicylic acid synthase
VDSKTALSDLGMDSVMTVILRRKLQERLRVQVPATLIRGQPTVAHLVKWFEGKLS